MCIVDYLTEMVFILKFIVAYTEQYYSWSCVKMSNFLLFKI